MSGQRNISLLVERSIYVVLELTRIVGVLEDHVRIKVRFSFIYAEIAEMALFIIARPVQFCACYPPMRSKYR